LGDLEGSTGDNHIRSEGASSPLSLITDVSMPGTVRKDEAAETDAQTF